jgi:hypothetical protein
MKNALLLIAFIVSTFGTTIFAQSWSYKAKLTASDRRGEDYLGKSNRIDEGYAITGVPNQAYDENNKNYFSEAGAAYIFELNNQGEWLEVAKLVSPERTYYREFGTSVEINGDYAVVSAHLNYTDENLANNMSGAGAVYIYKRSSAGVWSQHQKIVASDRATYKKFGNEVAFDGNTLIVTAKQTVYLFEKGVDDKWLETGKFNLPNYQTAREFSVSVSGDYAVVGLAENGFDASGSDEKSNAGQTIIYEKKNGVWEQVQVVVASDRFFDANFGISTSIDGNHLVVGANRMTEGMSTGSATNNSGAAYIFERQSNGTWTEEIKLLASDKDDNDEFASSLSIDGSFLIVCAPHQRYDENGENFLHGAGAIYVYENKGNNNWIESKKLIYQNRYDSNGFLNDINLSGNRFVGGMNHSEDDSNSEDWAGSLHVYELGSSNSLLELSYTSVNSFPNPAINNITFDITEASNSIEILNPNGQVVYQASIENQLGKITLDISTLSKGLYIVRVNNTIGTAASTFIKK